MMIWNILHYKKINWIAIILFYLTAILLAAPFNLDIPILGLKNKLQAFYYLPAALGPAIGGLLFWKSRGKIIITITGNRIVKSIIFCLIPVALFFAIGFQNDTNYNIHLYGLLFGLINLMYAFLEELGWRGYLLNALNPLTRNTRYMITGILWLIWHLRFHSTFDLVVFPLIVLIGSYAICAITEKTGTMMVAVGFHSLIILLTNSTGNGLCKIITLGATLICWHLMLRNWDNTKKLFL